MPSSRLGCPLSLKTPNMGNTGINALAGVSLMRDGWHTRFLSITKNSLTMRFAFTRRLCGNTRVIQFLSRSSGAPPPPPRNKSRSKRSATYS